MPVQHYWIILRTYRMDDIDDREPGEAGSNPLTLR